MFTNQRIKQQGSALILAMLVVSMVVVFATAAVWQQWRSSQIEVAERARLQANWILLGALDWARLILAEDVSLGGADHMAEPWAVPLMEARLTSFLAAERNITVDTSNLPEDAFLSGKIEDMQGRFNLWNLVQNNALSKPDLATLKRLFVLLDLPEAQAQQLAKQWLRSARAWANPQDDLQAPPLPRQVSQLLWLGVPAQTLVRISPYIAILPERTSINANTASAQVLAASMQGGRLSDAQAVITQRNSQPIVSMEALKKNIPNTSKNEIGINSNYFLVTGKLRIDAVVIQQRALVQRGSGTHGGILWREVGSYSSNNSVLDKKR